MANTTELDSTTRAEIVIRESLGQGDARAAVTEVMHALRGPLKRLLKPSTGRRADAAHFAARLAGTLLALLHQIDLYQAPEGFPASPAGYDLLTVFQAAYDAAMSPGEGM
jgi:hypothetical protein